MDSMGWDTVGLIVLGALICLLLLSALLILCKKCCCEKRREERGGKVCSAPRISGAKEEETTFLTKDERKITNICITEPFVQSDGGSAYLYGQNYLDIQTNLRRSGKLFIDDKFRPGEKNQCSLRLQMMISRQIFPILHWETSGHPRLQRDGPCGED